MDVCSGVDGESTLYTEGFYELQGSVDVRIFFEVNGDDVGTGFCEAFDMFFWI